MIGRRALAAAAVAMSMVAATAFAAAEDLVLPDEWTTEESSGVDNVELHYSPDLRCRIAVVSAAAERIGGDDLWSAVRQAAPGHGLSLEPGAEPVGFERGDFAGSIRLRQVAAEPSSWQLQACFYRKRNQHVCKPICQKLLD